MQNYKVHAALIVVGLIYGANYSIAKEVMPTYIQPFGFTLVRVGAATLLFWLYHAWKGAEHIDMKKDLPRLLLCALMGVATNQLFFLKGLNLTSPINAALIMTITPVLVLIASAILLKERVTFKKSLGIALGLTGAILLVLQRNPNATDGGILGDILILLNAASYGVYLVVVKPLMRSYRASTIIKWIFLFGFFMVLPFGWGEFSQTNWLVIPWPIWLAIVYVVVFTTFVAYLLNVWTLRYVNSSVVGIYIYLQPVFATLVAMLLGQDQPTADKFLYSALIFTGVYLVSRK
ncbi:DMT family transporter [Cesiribacter andamanensis]|uniref:Putative DMT superfamily transporter inner membrane protein n=1 Tax=Cesiribacter andamanensis AMV16 TaxID=1279009 RepID=M7N623_9BACT|nr:DMT family transporter [Cesiribacter andamanensis]EMR04078.1 putative DMT superfamily transporter inner membrane protein [Cesiribacter andamanensis AMV16]